MYASETSLFGAEELIGIFSRLVREGKLSHTYLFEGVSGTGKKTLCRFIARELASRSSETDTAILERIDHGTCPDVRIIMRDEGKKNISIDSVRDMIDDVLLTPAELDYKMYVFDGAETLSVQAQNALLKVIEEPPENVYIMLLCESVQNILTTVRSRAQTVRMPTFSVDEIKDYLSFRLGNTDDRIDFAARLARGSIGAALSLYENDSSLDAFRSAKNIIDAQSRKNRGVGYFDMLNLVTKAVTGREQIDALLPYLFSAYKDILSAKMSDAVNGDVFSAEECESYASVFTVQTVKESIEAITGIASDSAYNFNPTLAASALAVLLWRAA